jgi:hypothetical protein
LAAFIPHLSRNRQKEFVFSRVSCSFLTMVGRKCSTALEPSTFYAKEERFDAKAFDIENQPIQWIFTAKENNRESAY